jgi:hypothetical protein
MKTVNNLDQAKEHFARSIDPVVCQQEGDEPITATKVSDAESYYAETTGDQGSEEDSEVETVTDPEPPTTNGGEKESSDDQSAGTPDHSNDQKSEGGDEGSENEGTKVPGLM